MDLEECIWIEAALNQLKISPNTDPLETKYYEMGCYNCDGNKEDCGYYQKYPGREEGDGRTDKTYR